MTTNFVYIGLAEKIGQKSMMKRIIILFSIKFFCPSSFIQVIKIM